VTRLDYDAIAEVFREYDQAHGHLEAAMAALMGAGPGKSAGFYEVVHERIEEQMALLAELGQRLKELGVDELREELRRQNGRHDEED